MAISWVARSSGVGSAPEGASPVGLAAACCPMASGAAGWAGGTVGVTAGAAAGGDGGVASAAGVDPTGGDAGTEAGDGWDTGGAGRGASAGAVDAVCSPSGAPERKAWPPERESADREARPGVRAAADAPRRHAPSAGEERPAGVPSHLLRRYDNTSCHPMGATGVCPS